MRRLLVVLVLLAACAAAPEPAVERPPAGTPVIVISGGSMEWGYHASEVYANDLVIGISSEGVGRGQRERAEVIPGAYARVAEVLRRQGPAEVRATGRDVAICPGSADVIAATPPVGRFRVLNAPCGGDDAPFRRLFSAALGAIAPPR